MNSLETSQGEFFAHFGGLGLIFSGLSRLERRPCNFPSGRQDVLPAQTGEYGRHLA